MHNCENKYIFFVHFAMTFAMCHILHHILFDEVAVCILSSTFYHIAHTHTFRAFSFLHLRQSPNCIKLHWTEENLAQSKHANEIEGRKTFRQT